MRRLYVIIGLLGWALVSGCGPTLQTGTQRHEDGTKYIQYSYFSEGDDRIRHGEYREWFRDGQLRAEGQYVDGQREGDWTFYFPNGALRTSGEYEADRRVGVWTFRTAEGHKHARLTYGADDVQRQHFEVPGGAEDRTADSDRSAAYPARISAVLFAHGYEIKSCYELAGGPLRRPAGN
jgi:hypothetical protein